MKSLMGVPVKERWTRWCKNYIKSYLSKNFDWEANVQEGDGFYLVTVITAEMLMFESQKWVTEEGGGG